VTFTEPLAGNVASPAMLTELALLAFQLSTVYAPLGIVPGSAFNVIAGTCWPVEFFCVDIDPPPHPMLTQKSVSKEIAAEMRRTNRMRLLIECVR